MTPSVEVGIVDVVEMVGALDGLVMETFGGGGGGGGLTEVFVVLHIGGCEVRSHGGLGLAVVVVVAAAGRH